MSYFESFNAISGGKAMSLRTWVAAETTTHQDHVIAHVVGASVLGHLVFDEAAYLLLDIGFIWNIYLNGEMGLVPHPVAVAELGISDAAKAELRADVDNLLHCPTTELNRMTAVKSPSPIQDVGFLMNEDSRRVLLTFDSGSILVETSVTTREIRVTEVDGTSEALSPELVELAEQEEEFISHRLEKERGRTPTEDEVNEWIREHTESY
jgi:hypothetical protein